MIGNIPEKIVYIDRAKEQIDWEWDDFKRQNVKVGPTVIPLFIADPLKPKTIETGINWAECWGHTKHKPRQLELENKPFKIEIISLEKRSQGGRAYKVIFGKEKYYVDLREDVLLDTILECKIEKGVPDCEFIWGKVGSQMKLIRVGSELYKELTKSTEDGKKEKVKTKELEMGGVYRNKKGDLHIYFGNFWVLNYEENRNEYTGNYVIERVGFVKRQVWYSIHKWSRFSPRNVGFKSEQVDWDYYHINNVKSLNVIEKIDKFEIPSDWRKRIEKSCIISKGKSFSTPDSGYRVLSSAIYYASHMVFIPLNETPKFPVTEFFKPINDTYPNIEIIKEK